MPKLKKENETPKGPLFLRYALDLYFTGYLCGSVPVAKDMIRPWLESRAPKRKPESGPSLDELEAEVISTLPDEQNIEDEMARITMGFQYDEDEGAIFVRAGTLKAHLKDCALQVKDYLNHANFRSHVANKVYVQPDRLLVYRQDGSLVTTHDGYYDQPVHRTTRAGKISALKRIRYIERPVISCTLLVVNDGTISEEELRVLLDYGSIHGYGGERSLGQGQYTYKLTIEGGQQVPIESGQQDAMAS